MKSSFRLKRSTDFQRVRRFGKSYAHPLIVLVALPVEMDHIRVGIAASRAVGGAVLRNRAKRLVREAIRAILPRLNTGWDILIFCRRPILDSSLPEISHALTQLMINSGILINQNGI